MLLWYPLEPWLYPKCLAPFSVIVEDFKTSNICIDNCVYYESCDAPTSVVIINRSNGSRTIIHSNNNLPELTLDDFKKLDLSQYSWIHFEASTLVCPVSVMQKPNTCLTSSVWVQNIVTHFFFLWFILMFVFHFHFSHPFLTKNFSQQTIWILVLFSPNDLYIQLIIKYIHLIIIIMTVIKIVRLFIMHFFYPFDRLSLGYRCFVGTLIFDSWN